jgi:hypothetical protein
MSSRIPKSLALPALAAAVLALAAGAARAGLMDFVKKASDEVKKGQTGRKGRGRSDNAAAVRGLTEGADKQESSEPSEASEPRSPAADLQGLEWLEGIRIDEKELGDFIEEGGLLP